jgi:integrase/recombinase XerC
MTRDPAVIQHVAGLERDRYSPATVEARLRILTTIPSPLTIDREGIRAWWETRQTKPNGEPRAAASLSSESSHVREFYRWAIAEGLVHTNAADFLPKVRTASHRPTPVREGELYDLMRDAEPPMRQMLALGAMAGLRAAEIASVRWTDIDRAAGLLWVREGKGKKDRSVPLSAGLLAELGDPGEGRIIGKELSPRALSMAVGRYLRSHGVDSTAHKLRARYATRFLAATGDLVATAEAMGHSSVDKAT